MNSLYQDEIIALEDKNLQLRYLLGGLYPLGGNCNQFWTCDIKCRTLPVEDDEKFKVVQNFIQKHNISNSTFLSLTMSYLSGAFHSFMCDYGSLIPELDRVIMDYHFKHTNRRSFKENDLKEKELLELLGRDGNAPGTSLNAFLTQYSLTGVDFMILAKTRIHYKYAFGRGFEVSDLSKDLDSILRDNHLLQSYEWVQAYRESFEKRKVETQKGNEPKSLIKRITGRFIGQSI